ncbi:MAG: FAD binding domain-containing protein [Acidimicrobiales bacterium]
MTNVRQYSRPRELGEALRLLEQSGAVAVGGGTEVNSHDHDQPIAVVDLQELGLDGIELREPSALHIGATVTLQSLLEHADVPVALRDAARREVPSSLRSRATVGGSVCGQRLDSEVVAALLMHEAVAVVLGLNGRVKISIADLIKDRFPIEHRILTAVTIDPSGVTASERTGRTRADRPIVAVHGRRRANGTCRIVITGVADRPIVVDGEAGDVRGALIATAGFGDFRGSREYRRALAEVLTGRVLGELGR